MGGGEYFQQSMLVINKNKKKYFDIHLTPYKKIKDVSCPKIKDKTVKVSRQNIAEIPLWYGNRQIFLSSQKTVNLKEKSEERFHEKQTFFFIKTLLRSIKGKPYTVRKHLQTCM